MLVAPIAIALLAQQGRPDPLVLPVRTEQVQPIRNASFDKGGKAKKRVQGGNPRTVGGVLLFEGAQDGDRQVDPQVAVGGGYVLHATNLGLTIYDKKGQYVDGVPQSEFNGGIDPKLVFEPNSRTFVFNLWTYWDDEKRKPVNVSVSETADPRGAWNTYPVAAPAGVDGGAIGASRKWVGYSFPGGDERTFVMRTAELKAGRPATVWHFAGSLGHPVLSQDATDDLLFVALTDKEIVITRLGDDGQGGPAVLSVVRAPHRFAHFAWPPAAPQPGTDKTVAPGDRNPKNLVLQGGHVWFSHTVNVDGRAGVQWHQVRTDGTFVQSGLLAHPTNSFVQTTLAVNRRGDVLVGFQEVGPGTFVSGRAAVRRASDPPGTLRPTVALAEGKAATEGGPWGDYSGSAMDGDDGLSLWTVQSVATAAGRGGTVIARFPAPTNRTRLRAGG